MFVFSILEARHEICVKQFTTSAFKQENEMLISLQFNLLLFKIININLYDIIINILLKIIIFQTKTFSYCKKCDFTTENVYLLR